MKVTGLIRVTYCSRARRREGGREGGGRGGGRLDLARQLLRRHVGRAAGESGKLNWLEFFYISLQTYRFIVRRNAGRAAGEQQPSSKNTTAMKARPQKSKPCVFAQPGVAAWGSGGLNRCGLKGTEPARLGSTETVRLSLLWSAAHGSTAPVPNRRSWAKSNRCS